ncbi:hypothetical protein [Pseudotenacibaculum haliotis]|uniref:Toxin-antitoxin system YwqK family antitoxin n=1 Tax=Pseudotenacibaculum haliotis TaxID=1862138 RepID=A0ABW5LLZ7_9FLAO
MRKVIFILLLAFIACNKSNEQKEKKLVKQKKELTRIDTIIFNNSQIKEYHFWNKGKLDSIQKFIRGNYQGKGLVKDNFVTFYKKDGNKQYEGFLKEGKLNGLVYYYNNKGEISGTINYNNGVRSGIAMVFSKDTKIPNTIAAYKNDNLKDGLTLKFNNEGRLNYLSETFQNNSHTQNLSFYDNGVIKKISSRKYDSIKGYQLDGWSVFFDERGKIKTKVLYSDGKILEEQKVEK